MGRKKRIRTAVENELDRIYDEAEDTAIEEVASRMGLNPYEVEEIWDSRGDGFR